MVDEEFAAFRAILGELGAVYGRRLDDDVLSAYRKALQDLSLPQVQLACDRCARTRRFFPRPAELREALTEHGRDDSGVQAPRAECPSCHGSGWILYDCAGEGTCGIPACRVTRYAHSVAGRCQCRTAVQQSAHVGSHVG